ncbi:MAG TPA: histidine phosphatase family protein [Candidatus Saccharimonadales bacterium]|nr:histidine phosphatase family protein [Candidatus Saccharimonadales bacterium]
MKKLFFVRHGETVLNAAGLFSGRTETSLTPNGKGQAREAGLKLLDKVPHIDLIICSTLSRTLETAQIIADVIGYPKEEIVQNELFVERHWGEQEGQDYYEYVRNHNISDRENIKGVETTPMLQTRAEKAYEYVKSLPQENILIVSHGSFGRSFKRVIDGHPHTHEYMKEYHFSIGNAEIIELI